MITTMTVGSQPVTVHYTWFNEVAFKVDAILWRNIDVSALLMETEVFTTICDSIFEQAKNGKLPGADA